MSQKYSGLAKIKVGDKIGNQKEWKEEAAKKTGLTIEEVTWAVKASFEDSFEVPEGTDKNKGKILGKVVAAAKADFKAAKEMQQAENERRAKEAEALKARKDEMVAIYQAQTEQAIVVADDFAGNLKNVIEGAVEDYFAISDTGEFILKDEGNAKEAFAAGFARLKSLFDKSKQLGGGFALYEAKLALAAEKQFGAEWPNFFGGTEPAEVRRIARNMKAIKEITDLGFEVGEIPIGTLLALTEVRYDREDKENNKAIKAKVIQEFMEASEEAGGPINQKEALKMVRNATLEKKSNSMHKWNYVYIFGDGSVRGSNAPYDEKTEAVLVIDKNQRICAKKEDGTFEYKPIPSFGGEQAEKDAKAQVVESKAEEKPAAKKAAKKAATKQAKVADVIPIKEETAPKQEEEQDGEGLGDLDSLLA